MENLCNFSVGLTITLHIYSTLSITRGVEHVCFPAQGSRTLKAVILLCSFSRCAKVRRRRFYFGENLFFSHNLQYTHLNILSAEFTWGAVWYPLEGYHRLVHSTIPSPKLIAESVILSSE